MEIPVLTELKRSDPEGDVTALTFRTVDNSEIIVRIDRGCAAATAMVLVAAAGGIESQPLMLTDIQAIGTPRGDRALRLVFHNGAAFDLEPSPTALDRLKHAIASLEGKRFTG